MTLAISPASCDVPPGARATVLAEEASQHTPFGGCQEQCKAGSSSEDECAGVCHAGLQAEGQGACAGPAVPPQPLQQQQPAVVLRKHLLFTDARLESAYQCKVAEQHREEEAQWVALRALAWTVIAARLASSGFWLVVGILAVDCLLPALLQLLLMAQWWEWYKSYHTLVSSLAQLASDVAGFSAMHYLYAGQSSAQAVAAVAAADGNLWTLSRGMMELPCQAAAYLAVATSRSSATFIVRLGCATVTLLIQLCALRSIWGGLPLPSMLDSPSTAAAVAAVQLASVTLLALAYCVPLCHTYGREVRARAAFVHGRGGLADASHLDGAWEPLSFVVPALAQVLSVWSYLG